MIHISPHVWMGATDALFTCLSPDGSGDGEHRDYLYENIRFESPGALLSVNLPKARLHNFAFETLRFRRAPIKACFAQMRRASLLTASG